MQNSRKARIGGLAGLLDPAIMAKKQADEKALREAIARDAKLKDTLAAWDTIAKAEKVRAANIRPYTQLEAHAAFNTELFDIARTLLRAAEERPKPNADRLREFRESNLESLQLQLFSDEPIYDDYEIVKFADSLTWFAEQLGYNHALVQKVLHGKSPQERANELIRGTKLKDVSLRKKLYEGGQPAVAACDDPLIALAKLVDPEARTVRKTIETQVEEVKRQAYAQIARAKYAVEGASTYPDATFTLRLAFGTVKGYEENGKQIPF